MKKNVGWKQCMTQTKFWGHSPSCSSKDHRAIDTLGCQKQQPTKMLQYKWLKGVEGWSSKILFNKKFKNMRQNIKESKIRMKNV